MFCGEVISYLNHRWSGPAMLTTSAEVLIQTGLKIFLPRLHPHQEEKGRQHTLKQLTKRYVSFTILSRAMTGIEDG